MFRLFVQKPFKRFPKGNGISRSLLFYSKRAGNLPLHSQRLWPYVLGFSIIGVGGIGYYCFQSNSLQVMGLARQLHKSGDIELRWRDAIASSLMGIVSKNPERPLLLKGKWGTILGNWIVDDSTYIM